MMLCMMCCTRGIKMKPNPKVMLEVVTPCWWSMPLRLDSKTGLKKKKSKGLSGGALVGCEATANCCIWLAADIGLGKPGRYRARGFGVDKLTR